MTASTGPSDRQLLIDEWDASRAKARALAEGRGTGYGVKRDGLLGHFAAWAVEAFGSTAVMAAWDWSVTELDALCSTRQLGVTQVRVTGTT